MQQPPIHLIAPVEPDGTHAAPVSFEVPVWGPAPLDSGPIERWFVDATQQHSAPGMTARSVYVTVEHPVSIQIEHDEAGDMHIHVAML